MTCKKEVLHSFLTARRSVRRFLPDPVPAEVLDRVLETARYAPSAHNRQPWRIVVLESPGAREKLADGMGAELRRDLLADGLQPGEVDAQVGRSRQRITGAPAAIALFLDMSEMDRFPDEKRSRAEYLMGVQSAALFGGTILYAAHAEGLGAVWICAPLFAPKAVTLALDVPSSWEPQGLLLLGYPAVVPDPKPRKEISEFRLTR